MIQSLYFDLWCLLGLLIWWKTTYTVYRWRIGYTVKKNIWIIRTTELKLSGKRIVFNSNFINKFQETSTSRIFSVCCMYSAVRRNLKPGRIVNKRGFEHVEIHTIIILVFQHFIILLRSICHHKSVSILFLYIFLINTKSFFSIISPPF